MNERRIFRIYLVLVCCVIAVSSYLAYTGSLHSFWFVLLSIICVAIHYVWYGRLLDEEWVCRLQSEVDAPYTSDVRRDFCRQSLDELEMKRERRTLEYWRREWNYWRQDFWEARHSRALLNRGEDPIKRDACAWRCSREVAMKLHHLEKHVNEMVHGNIMGRVGELESRERWRTTKEWFALRDEWRRLVSDPATPPDLRAYYARCLEEYPDTPPSGPRYLS